MGFCCCFVVLFLLLVGVGGLFFLGGGGGGDGKGDNISSDFYPGKPRVLYKKKNPCSQLATKQSKNLLILKNLLFQQ